MAQDIKVPLPRGGNDLLSAKELSDCSQLLSHEVNKYTLYLTRQKDLNLLQTSTKQMLGRLTVVIATLRSGLSYAGPTLAKILIAKERDILGAISMVASSSSP